MSVSTELFKRQIAIIKQCNRSSGFCGLFNSWCGRRSRVVEAPGERALSGSAEIVVRAAHERENRNEEEHCDCLFCSSVRSSAFACSRSGKHCRQGFGPLRSLRRVRENHRHPGGHGILTHCPDGCRGALRHSVPSTGEICLVRRGKGLQHFEE